MIKRILTAALSLIMLFSLGVSVSAHADTGDRVIDEAGVLGNELQELNILADRVSELAGMNICLFITDDCKETDIKEYADSLYEASFPDSDGMAFTYCIESGDYLFSFYGNGMLVINEEIKTQLAEAFKDHDGYTEASEAFLNRADDLMRYRFPECLKTSGTETTAQIPKERQLPRLVDEAGLLNESEASNVLINLDTISEELKFDVIVVTVNSLDGKTPTQYADDFFDYNGYGYGHDKDGALLLLSMENRDYAFSTHGYGETAFLLGAKDAFQKEHMALISKGKYEKGFIKYAQQCQKFVEEARENEPFDNSHKPVKASFIWTVSIVLGFFLGALLTKKQKDKLTSVKYEKDVCNYEKPGSLHITHKNDYPTGSRFTSRKIHTSSSSSSDSSSDSGSHYSSSGESHGGWSGKF